jgi:hypothetical protein
MKMAYIIDSFNDMETESIMDNRISPQGRFTGSPGNLVPSTSRTRRHQTKLRTKTTSRNYYFLGT